MIPKLDEHKIMTYLDEYQIQALYQKTGYLISLCNHTLKFSESFFASVKKKIHKGVLYMSDEAKENGTFIKDYQVIVPKWLEERSSLHEI